MTLLELSVVLAIVGILTGLSVASLSSLKANATFGGATGELVSAMRVTQAQAIARGTNTAFIIDSASGRYWGIQTTSAFSLPAFTPSTATILTSGTLPVEVTFGPAAGYGAALATPLGGIPMTAGQGPNYLYCSFCLTAGLVGYGSMLFEPGGPVRFSNAVNRIGEQFTLTSSRENRVRVMAVSISQRTGTIETFERR